MMLKLSNALLRIKKNTNLVHELSIAFYTAKQANRWWASHVDRVSILVLVFSETNDKIAIYL